METARAKRLLSLDAFRGFTIASMILVDSSASYGHVYPQLSHAQWNGWTFADTVFPSFLFIMGVSMVFSLARRKEEHLSDSILDLQIVRRAIILFALGLFMNSYPLFDLSTLRIPGVLQRISLCYLFSSLIVRRCGPKGQAYWLIGLLASYWLMMRLVPVPGVGAGDMEPGKNLAAYIDSLFLKGHMYYGTWDPEGLLSTIPAIGTTLFGVLTGNLVRSPASGGRKVGTMVWAGVALVVLGAILGRWLPINKNIWTSSYCVFMAGLALLTLALFYWLIDLKGYKQWAFVFVVFGMNSIAIYVLSEIFDPLVRTVLHYAVKSTVFLRTDMLTSVVSPLARGENVSLLIGISYVIVMFLPAWILWKMKLFIKV